MGASPRDRATLRLRLGLLIGGLLVAGAAGAQEAAMQDEAGRGVTFRWWGQACYSVTDADGRAVLVDPFPKEFGYAPPTVTPLVVLISHEHRDHNAVDNVPGQPAVLRGAGDHEAAGLTFRGVATWHDAQQGAQRGPNTVFTWSVAGLKVAHLGDLGHLLSDEQIAAIGPAGDNGGHGPANRRRQGAAMGAALESGAPRGRGFFGAVGNSTVGAVVQ